MDSFQTLAAFGVVKLDFVMGIRTWEGVGERSIDLVSRLGHQRLGKTGRLTCTSNSSSNSNLDTRKAGPTRAL
jgi:hypothetical protein